MSDLLSQAQEKVQELIDSANECADEAENYLNVATRIDDDKEARADRDLNLDDLDYGEERIRLRETPQALRTLADDLSKLSVENLGVKELDEIFQQAEEAIGEVKSTIDDCTPLPS